MGSSGGIDSALTLALAVEALGAENVTAITMPSEYSSSGSVSDSEVPVPEPRHPLLTHPIRALVDWLQGAVRGRRRAIRCKGLPLENLQARIRGVVLMEYSNSYGHLLLTTGNKSEISVGYCTLYGDTNGGLGLIGDLYKTEVFALSRHLNDSAGPRARFRWPSSRNRRRPSSLPGQKDTDSLPPYEILDEVLKVLIEGERLAAGASGRQAEGEVARAFREQGRTRADRAGEEDDRSQRIQAAPGAADPASARAGVRQRSPDAHRREVLRNEHERPIAPDQPGRRHHHRPLADPAAGPRQPASRRRWRPPRK